jgi:glycosyltransferase involved in cell wall biosynthesis
LTLRLQDTVELWFSRSVDTTAPGALSMKVGFLLLGNPPFYNTGYGTQLRYIGDKLVEAGYPVAHVPDFGYAGAAMEWEGRTVFPLDSLPGKLNEDTFNKHLRGFQKKQGLDHVIVWSLGDTWKFKGLVKHPFWVCMTPVDSDRLDSRTLHASSSAWKSVSISQHGLEIMREQGLEDSHYLPHMIPSGYRPVDREYARTANRIPHNAFVVGFFGDMSMRKCPYENIEAFARFRQHHPDAFLFIKAASHTQQVAYEHILAQYGLEDCTIGIHPYDSLIGLTNEEMARALSCMDVLLHASCQEGFGLLQVEAQSCGVPVINTDFGPMTELQGWKELSCPVDRLNRIDNGGLVGYASPVEIHSRLDAVYERRDDIDKTRQQLVDFASSYRVDAVWDEHYQPFIDQIVSELPSLDRLSLPPRELRKVALVTTWGIQCGIATYSEMLATHLSQLGIEVVILAEGDEPTTDAEDDEDAQFLVYRCWNRQLPVAGYLKDVLGFEDPDVIHVQHEWQVYPNSAILEALREVPAKKVITYHTPAREGLRSLSLISDFIVDAHVTHWPETTQFIPQVSKHGMLAGIQTIKHGILLHDIDYDEARDYLKVPRKVPVFFTYGFASGSKGLDYFVDAAIEAAASPNCRYFEVIVCMSHHPEWDFSALAEDVRAKADKYDFITVIEGWMDDDALDLHAAGSDYLVFPYRFPQQIDSASGAVRRVLGHGKPLLVTDEGRLRDIVGGLHGWKFGQYDQSAFAAAIVDAASCAGTTRYQSMSDAVQKLADDSSWPAIAGQHAELYRTLCGLWSVVPEPMSTVRKIDVETPFPEILDSVEGRQTDRWFGLEGEEE